MYQRLIRFRRLLNQSLGTKELADHATRREQLRKRFLWFPTAFFVSAAYVALVVWIGALPIVAVVGCAAGGILSTKETLWTMRRPLNPSTGVAAYLRDYKVGWGMLGTMCFVCGTGSLDKSHGWLLFFGFVGAIGSMIAGYTLLLWVFREPFWQFVTGTPWPEEPPDYNVQQSFGPVCDPLPFAPDAPKTIVPFDY